MASILQRLRGSTVVFYWPSAQRGGKGFGHLSVLFDNDLYASHLPDMAGNKELMGVRDHIPGSSMTNIKIFRHPSVRFRTLAEDEQKFGKEYQTLILPKEFLAFQMKEAAKRYLLASAPDEPPLHGPLDYYQLADSAPGRGDRSQCTTTTAAIVASGVPMSEQEFYKAIVSQFQPDSLWDELCRRVKAEVGVRE